MTRILIVDDEPDILESTATLLRAYGYEVQACGEVPKIIDQIRAFRPDIVLQDLYMPGLDTAKLMRTLRSHGDLDATRVLIFTASTEAEDVAERVGADGFIRKPFDANTIKQVLDEWAARAPTRKPMP